MDNWRDYVGLQLINENDFNSGDPLYIYYIKPLEGTTVYNQDNTTQPDLSFRIDKHAFKAEDVKLSSEETGKLVEQCLSEFPLFDEVQDPDKRERRAAAAGIRVARNSNRGTANKSYKNSIFYKGLTQVDAPIFVASCKDAFYVFKHPDFDKWGFVL